MMLKTRRSTMLLAVIALPLIGTGCISTPYRVAGHRNITNVSTFYNTSSPWLNFDNPPDNVPQGLKFSVFLTASETELGVFGDGVFTIDLFLIERDEENNPIRTPITKWKYTTEQAMPFRSKRPTKYGWGYGFRLNWGDADVLGKEIMTIVSFQRASGAVVHGTPFYHKVPHRAGKV